MSNDFREELTRIATRIKETKEVMKNAGVELSYDEVLHLISQQDAAQRGVRILQKLTGIESELKTLQHAIKGPPKFVPSGG